ncbi:MAG TPA: SOS response-associated peptidase [Candidatus Acidoferrales bacterium]|jgi:putative SOS response-associated peptidase YedK|nr:SOS response-associated peptidase [Candidatus Acidoferrales bacterium]
MCNRYALTKKRERVITREFGSLELYFMERFNIALSQSASIILVENGKLVKREMQWGRKVKWTKAPLLNAQRESIDKPVLWEAFEMRRCLVPASGFYEWTDYAGHRQPLRFEFEDERLFCFAGLYSAEDKDGVENFVIMTVPANEYVQKVHTRMPFIVATADYDAWLNPKGDLYKQVAPAAEQLISRWINRKMNSPKYDDAESASVLESPRSGGPEQLYML